MGNPKWYKLSNFKKYFLIVLSFVFVVSFILSMTLQDFAIYGMFFTTSGFIIIIVLIVHFNQSYKRKKVGKELIAVRNRFLLIYSLANIYDTEWGVHSFGDKLTITTKDNNEVIGYLSHIDDEIQIVNNDAEVISIPKSNVKSIKNEDLYSILKDPVRKARSRYFQTSSSFSGRHITRTGIRYFSLWDSFSPYIEECIKNRDVSMWKQLKKIGEETSKNSEQHSLQNEFISSLINIVELKYSDTIENILNRVYPPAH